jgi:hypothetical protein
VSGPFPAQGGYGKYKSDPEKIKQNLLLTNSNVKICNIVGAKMPI